MSPPWMIIAIFVVVAIGWRAIDLGFREKTPTKPQPRQWEAFEAPPMATATEMLTGFWARSGDSPAPFAAAEAAMLDLELRYDLVLPDDFRAYLLGIAPAEDYWDEGDATWWAPSRIRNIPEEYDHPLDSPAIAAKAERCLFFADHLIWCWAWAICCEPGEDYGKVAIISDGERWVADSFTDFVRAHVTDPLSVY